MNRVFVSAEGQTEETFVRDVLRPHLRGFNVELQSVVITTRIVKQGNKFKGGLSNYNQARKEIIRLLHDSNVVAVTTLYDLYQLPNDFPGQATCPVGNGRAKALHLEQAFRQDINSPRFYPHLQVHEFEAFLFVDPVRTASLFPEKDLAREIRNIRQSFPTPEDINNDPKTAPSKRIKNLYPNYDKPLYGALAVLEVGLDVIRNECPHFGSWLLWLEGLGNL